MPEKSRQAYDEWKRADGRAREAEARLARAWDDYFAHRGGPPSAQLIQEVARLRAIANDRLTATMVTLAERSRPEGPDSQPPPH